MISVVEDREDYEKSASQEEGEHAGALKVEVLWRREGCLR